ncbi:MAG: hypothetical protein ACK44F_07130 [Roseococcus sp.]
MAQTPQAKAGRPDRLTDGQAKEKLQTWPESTEVWGGEWLRGRPARGGVSLYSAGAIGVATVPDGLWLCASGMEGRGAGDVIAIEVCGSLQNFYDKRSRYAPGTVALQAELPKTWLEGGYQGSRGRPRWQVLGLSASDRTRLAVRHLRVLYALTARDHEQWKAEGVRAAHEFLIRHSALGSFTAQGFQAFLERMGPSANLYSR